MFYPHRELTEIVLQLPPLEVQLEVLTVKFLCKCLTANDMMTNIVHQINGSLNTHLHFQVNSINDYLVWKLKLRSRRNIDLSDPIIIAAARYNKAEMEDYVKVLWMNRTVNRCQVRNRNSPHDFALYEAIKCNSIKITKLSYLFGHSTPRYLDSRVMEFVHGSSTRFQNFCHSIGKVNNSVCQYCESDIYRQSGTSTLQLYCP